MDKVCSIEELFVGRHFDREVILLCVRWYLRYKLSFRDLVQMMAERPHSSLDYRTPQEFRQQFGYADVESKKRFPHPHSGGGGETISTPKQNRDNPVIKG